MNDISGSQTRLTENLHLLQALGYSNQFVHKNSPAIFRYRNVDDSDAQSDLRLLDVIATCLTTGKPGDVVAAAFDKREQISLVLAKSGNVDSADYAATHAFLSALREARSWIDLLPFLATHSKQNMDKRVRNVHESITDLCDELKSAATSYTFDSLEDNFPRSRLYRKAKYPEEPPTPQRFLYDLIDLCIMESADFDMQDNTSSCSQYVQLFGASDALRRSSFLWYVASKYFEGGDSKFKGRVERLSRRLDKVCQYAKIHTLMRLVKRLPTVPFYWVEDNLVGMGEEPLEICKDPMEVVKRVLGRLPSLQEPDTLFQCYPDMNRNWEQQQSMNPRVHPEIRIILHLSRPVLSGLSTLRNDPMYRPIGCSKKSCLCCILWIVSFNELTGMSWAMSGCHGKPYDDWALPGAAGEMERVEHWRDLDRNVIDRIRLQLGRELCLLMGDSDNELRMTWLTGCMPSQKAV